MAAVWRRPWAHFTLGPCSPLKASVHPPGPVPPAAVSSAPARGQLLDHVEVWFCLSFSSVGQIGKTWQELGHVRDNGLHTEHLGKGPKSWDLQGSEDPGQFPSFLERSLWLLQPYVWSLRVQTARRSEHVLSRLPSYVKVYTIEFLNKYV